MTEELKPGEIWVVGCYSATLNARIPHWMITDQYPLGRITTDVREAWEWAHEDALHFNKPEELNGAEDWEPAVWAGVAPFEYNVPVTPIESGE